MPILVVAADASKARIFATDGDFGPLYEAEDLVHPESRLREQDLVADGPGSGSDSGGYGKHSMGHEKAAHERQADLFAAQVCERIEKFRQQEKLRRIYLVAAPDFLGLLRANLSKPCQTLVSEELGKNLVTLRLEELRRYLPKKL